jgi:hypothetical protein
LNQLHKCLETVYETKGFPYFQKSVLDFLYRLLVHQRPPGYLQRWEKENLALEIARMQCMKHIFLREDVWHRLRRDLEYYLDQAHDGEMRLVSEQDFLDEIERELLVQKIHLYSKAEETCAIYKWDLIAAVMHPERIEKFINVHGMDQLEHVFGY